MRNGPKSVTKILQNISPVLIWLNPLDKFPISLDIFWMSNKKIYSFGLSVMYRIMQISIIEICIIEIIIIEICIIIRLGCHQLRLRVTLICILYVILSFIQWLWIIKISAKTCSVWLYMFFALFAFHGQSIGVVNNVITKWHQSRDLKHCVVPTCTPHI